MKVLRRIVDDRKEGNYPKTCGNKKKITPAEGDNKKKRGNCKQGESQLSRL